MPLSNLDTQQDDVLISQEFPKAKGWRTPDLCQYQGFWHEPGFLQGILSFQKHFKAKDTDIVLVTPPKCGTTWLKALIFTLVNRKEHHPLSQQHPLLAKNPHDLVPLLEIQLYVGNRVPDLSTFTSPRLISTHAPLVSLTESIQASKCKLVYLCRNPKDTFISNWYFVMNTRVDADVGISSFEEAFEMFCKGMAPYGPFWDHVLGYWKKSLEKPDEVFFLTYEGLKDQPVSQLRSLAAFLGHPFSAEEEMSGTVDAILKLCSFENLTSLEVNKLGKISNGKDCKIFFRKGEVGDWKNHLTAEMVGRLDALMEEKLEGSGLKL